jgi:hypothetical protein
VVKTFTPDETNLTLLYAILTSCRIAQASLEWRPWPPTLVVRDPPLLGVVPCL